MICAVCLQHGRPLWHTEADDPRPIAGPAITVRAGAAVCLDHLHEETA